MRERVVIVGSSVAGIRTGQALRAGGFDGDIVVIGAEDADPYDKPPLSKEFLTGQKSATQFALLDGDGWEGSGLEPVLGHPATALDCAAKHVTLDSGRRIDYDRLVIATGARARCLTDTAGDPVGHTIRDLSDSQALKSALQGGGHVVIIGGGFIGCEVASTARHLGCAATIVDVAAVPLADAVGTTAGRLLGALHTDGGTTVLADARVDSVQPDGDGGARVALHDGRVLEADILVAGIGVMPNTEWLADSGVVLDNGVRTDEFCRVLGANDVYAVGDVANWHDVSIQSPRRVGHWTNAVDQANNVAHNIIHPDQPREYHAAPYFWSDQYGSKIQMVGHAAPTDAVEIREFEVSGRRCWAAVFSRQSRITAAITLGWPRAMAALRRLWLQHADARDALTELQALAERSAQPKVAAPR
jgi:3-phenylpropionate/trans-cinnamate dioxygenase ferredoxin reductase component